MKASSIVLSLVVLGGIVYLLFPVIVVVTISFSSATYLNFPPPGFSLQWYLKMLNDPEWLSAFWVTIKVGVLASLMATLVGVPAAFALVRNAIPGKSLLNAIILSALVTPPIVSAIGVFIMYVPLGLVNSLLGLAGAHAVAGIPFVVINTAASLRSADQDLERAAIIHGASPLAAAVRITLPIIVTWDRSWIHTVVRAFCPRTLDRQLCSRRRRQANLRQDVVAGAVDDRSVGHGGLERADRHCNPDSH